MVFKTFIILAHAHIFLTLENVGNYWEMLVMGYMVVNGGVVGELHIVMYSFVFHAYGYKIMRKICPFEQIISTN